MPKINRPLLPIIAEFHAPGQPPVWWEFDGTTHHVSAGAASYDTDEPNPHYAAGKFAQYMANAAQAAGLFEYRTGAPAAPGPTADTVAWQALAALHYLLEQTVDNDINHGIGLTEGEEDARAQALAVFELAEQIGIT